MNKLDMDRWIAGKQSSAASVPILRTVSWRARRGEVVPVAAALPERIAQGLGLEWAGANPDGSPTGYVKPEDAPEPDTVAVREVPARRAVVAQDGTAMPEGTQDDDRYEGIRQLVARECDVDNRRGEGGTEYYAEKYPPYVRMAEREMDAKQRAAALAASHGVKIAGGSEK